MATRGLAVELARRGIGVDVVTSAWEMPVTKGLDPAPEPGSPGVRIHRVWCRRRGLHDSGLRGAATYLWSAWGVVRRLLRLHQYDVVHIYFSLPTGVLLPLARAQGIPAVVSLRGSDVPGYDTTNKVLERLHRLLRPVNRFIWRRSSRVVALSAGLGETARRADPRLRFTVVPNGVDGGLFRPGDQRNRSDGIVRCLSVARLTPRKGHLCLLEAFALLPSGRCTLEIAGAGELESEIRRTISRLGLEGRVTLSGPLNHAELAERYRAADLFTLLPEHESFGNAFAEALAAGLPIVATRAGAIPELVEHGVNGLLVPPGDPRAAAEAILALADDRPRREAMARRNRARAEAELTWSGVADRYLRVYAEAGARRFGELIPTSTAP